VLQIVHLNASIRQLRKLLSILLLAFIGLPVLSPLFASTTQGEASVPACCRRNGMHHCMGSMAQQQKPANSLGVQFTAPMEKCPYCPAMPTAVVGQLLFLPPSANADFGGLSGHILGIAQTASKLHISSVHSRPKRGPPTA
jgi:hypothetical protein